MNIMDIKRFDQIEEIIATIHKAFPHVPKPGRRILAELTPYASFCVAMGIATAQIASFLIPVLPPSLLPLNLLLLRTVGILLTMVLFLAFKPLSLWMKKGWYMLFYASLMQFLVTLLFFNVYSFGAQVLVWYVLLEIKKEYS